MKHAQPVDAGNFDGLAGQGIGQEADGVLGEGSGGRAVGLHPDRVDHRVRPAASGHAAQLLAEVL
jgi:hypothetical protein